MSNLVELIQVNARKSSVRTSEKLKVGKVVRKAKGEAP